jgi:hypothetical protein
MRGALLTLFLSLCLFVSNARAQEPPQEPAAPSATQQGSAVPIGGITVDDINAQFRGSFFLSPLEIAIIQQALKGVASNAATVSMATQGAVVPERRVIRVSGVVYRAPKDWIVWMNGHKVTPAKLLPEIVDINVKNSSEVDLDWFDAGLNRVISITLRPQQTYDITTGILLPGTQ